ncbi:hypothetical protein BDY17DRAFT_105042 [Neohortaea acidophila]|uniref:Uncharacterized protein n=1 Tax=Neohortaea acidophila TaxID=245834 RepID=A0A6A6Q1E7_9PEZI|nr:uncharacterized protein BDY17DRAFT_105042 [Neohortaea acidophila]KAF2485503.1 hypothetical protein BDY17DRAFT_105042 [Neohortaea acidophila]
MPIRHSLLRLEVPALQSVDTSRVEDLFGMWSLFSKASHAVEDGKRLENLSWRLWNRETFCCQRIAQSRPNSPPPIPIQQPQADNIPVPDLSSSLDSLSSSSSDLEQDAPCRPTAATSLPNARPELRCTDTLTNRGNEKHITAVDLEKIVISIRQTKDLEQKPIELPIPTSTTPHPRISPQISPPSPSVDDPSGLTTTLTTATDEASDTTSHAPSLSVPASRTLESSTSTVDTDKGKESQSFDSEASSNTEMSSHSIIRGFNPGGVPSSYRSQTNLAVQPTPILKTAPRKFDARPKRKGPMFTIGTSSGEDESSLESHMFKSALSESLKRPGSTLSSSSGRKQTSFKEEVAIGRAAEHSPVFESDDEDEEVSESAIEEDDDDSSDWEDSEDQSAHSSVNEKDMFQRVDSRPTLTSRRSLLTTLIHEPDRARALANAASRSTPAIHRSRHTSPSGPSLASTPEEGSQLQLSAMAPTSEARPIIMTTSNGLHSPQAMSPRSTRRNMLSTELTESLRKNLLWERQHKSTSNLPSFKRRHTSNDVKNLKQHPEPVPLLTPKNGTRTFTNDFFHAGLQEYHTRGW